MRFLMSKEELENSVRLPANGEQIIPRDVQIRLILEAQLRNTKPRLDLRTLWD